MNALKVAGVVVLLWVTACWNQSDAGRSLLFGHRFNPMLVVLVIASVRSRPGVAAFFGFMAGVLTAGPAGADMTALALSRTAAAFLTSLVVGLGLQVGSLLVGLVAIVFTLVAQTGLLFMAQPPDIGAFLGVTIGTAIYNGVVAASCDALLRRWLDPPVD